MAEPPISDFGIVQDEYCGAPATVQFTDNSQSSLPLTWFWDFGDGDTLTTLNPNPGHTYLDTGHFVVHQLITNYLRLYRDAYGYSICISAAAGGLCRR